MSLISPLFRILIDYIILILFLHQNPQKFIALGKIRELNIMVPSEQEQLKLGTYFESIDNLITLHQSKLDKLKNLKKSYLNEMFI